MAIVDLKKLQAALASKDKAAIKEALSSISTGELSSEEKAALYVSLFEAQLDVQHDFNEEYKKALKERIASLEKLNSKINTAEDKENIANIKKSI